MTNSEQLNKVKAIMLITTSQHDTMLEGYIAEVKDFMKRAGISPYVLKEDRVVGVIAKGVSDLWTQGELSEYCKSRIAQIALDGDV